MAAMVSSMYFSLGAEDFPEAWSSSSPGRSSASHLPFSLDVAGLSQDRDDSDAAASPDVSLRTHHNIR
jgi:hypothetical protein